jgi:hypothetical protein
MLLEVNAETPAVSSPTFLGARQPGYRDEARLDFFSHGPYDAIEVWRDCQPLAQISGGATSFLDTQVQPGFHDYRVRGVRGGAVSDIAGAGVQIGRGAVLGRTFLWPARSPQQLTRDPLDGSYLVAVNWPGDERKVYHYDRNFRYLETRESAVEAAWQIAALAVRVAPGRRREINYVTWLLPVPVDQVASQRFFLVKEGSGGELLGRTQIFPPRPTNGFITFPTGLAWDSDRDTFYYLERNSKTFVEMSPGGELIRQIPHPAPPFQNFVFNLGVDYVPERGTLFITGAGRLDYRITRVMEMTLAGALTGVEIPVGALESTLTGITVHGDDLVAVGNFGSFAEIFRIKAFPGTLATFARGDVNLSGRIDLTDALLVLNYLFLEGPAPACEDAADADDSSALNLADVLVLLNYLFANAGGVLPPPFPATGVDPTPDGLTCFGSS